MAKITTKYVCQSCGYVSPRWVGKCPECEGFNTFAEEKVAPVSKRSTRLGSSANSAGQSLGGTAPRALSEVGVQNAQRMETGIGEFDRVLGGGLVPGSLVLIGGDPGIGKSTLLIETSVRLAGAQGSGLYISGEESVEQIRLRADRLGLQSELLMLAAETDLLEMESHIRANQPAFVVVDSIQTTAHPALDAAPGTLTQVRESATFLQRIAKELGVAVFIVGHVNKEGNLAGPRALEHIVDTVLQLEGDEHGQFRILRALKNRFGSTNELGVFEMTESGMNGVENPSQLFLRERQNNAPGSVVVATVEGARPLLVEVQALCAPSYFTSPRRTVTGADFNRVLVALAVIEKRLGVRLGDMDVYVNVVGGVRVTEPALDLGIALAVISSVQDTPVPAGYCVFGELGLGGEVRGVRHGERRISEAARLGLTHCIAPSVGLERILNQNKNSREQTNVLGARTLQEATDAILPGILNRAKRRAPSERAGKSSANRRDQAVASGAGKKDTANSDSYDNFGRQSENNSTEEDWEEMIFDRESD